MNDAEKSILESTPGGGEVEKPYRYMPSQRVWFVNLYGPKTGINSSMESSMVFERTTGAYERIYRINSRQMRIRNAFK